MYMSYPDRADSTAGSLQKRAKPKTKNNKPRAHDAGSSPALPKHASIMSVRLGKVLVEDDTSGLSEDVKLWLEFTGYNDLEYRSGILNKLRRLKAVNEQRSQLISELAELQSASGDFLGASEFCPASASVRTSPSPTILQQQKTSDSGSSTEPKTEPEWEATAKFQETPFHDGAVELEDNENETSAMRNDFTSYNDEASLVSTSESTRRGALNSAKSNFPAVPRDVLPTIPRKYQAPQLQEPESHQTRYFLIKSFNFDNVEMSQNDGCWVTKRENSKLLTDAFKKSDEVILFYSVNKSGAFQGYARLQTPPHPSCPKSPWMRNIHWETSWPFRVDWLNTRTTEFWEAGHLHNSLFEYKKVFVGKDGQEISPDCGRLLVKIMDSPKVAGKKGKPGPAFSEKNKAMSWREKAKPKTEEAEAVDNSADWQPINTTTSSPKLEEQDVAVEVEPEKNEEAAKSVVDLIEC